MSLFRPHRWFVAAAAITLAFAAVSLTGHKSPGLSKFADLVGLALMLGAAAVTLANALRRPGQERTFWGLMALGFSLWAVNWFAWALWEVVWHLEVPDPFPFDIVLFFHVVPMLGAVAWRPDLRNKEEKVTLSLLNFLMLTGWWLFLYAFIVFPHQYITIDAATYNYYYDGLYGVENVLLAAVLGFAAWTSSAGWRRLYLHLLGAFVVYAIDAQLVDRATADNSYFSGSWYDIPLIGSLVWATAAALSAGQWELKPVTFNLAPRWKQLVPRLAMLAIVSLPALGLWTFLFDKSPPATRMFRLFAVLTAMLVLGAFVFLRQYLQDQALMRVLEESRKAYENQQRLQNHLVQKEKLASLAHLVAGAAQEINHPLSAIMFHSDQLWTREHLTGEQSVMVRKIVDQARRTRDLVANLLSFAQQSHGERVSVDLVPLLQRCAQMLETKHCSDRIKISVGIEPGLPQVAGNANQLFQAFYEIMENAMDALAEVGGGSLEISALRHNHDAVLQFSDTGPGLREPERVFDPFYTTKPVGKGTGLGLSAAYGVVQDHGGQITCQNKSEGGALFILRLPAAVPVAAPAAEAAKA